MRQGGASASVAISLTAHFARQQSAGVSVVKHDSDAPPPNPVGTAKLGRVSRRDRDVLRKYAQALAVPHLQSPPGNLREALEAMRRIEQQRGIDPRAYADKWPDLESHVAYLDAVHRKMSEAPINGTDAATPAPENPWISALRGIRSLLARCSARWAVFWCRRSQCLSKYRANTESTTACHASSGYSVSASSTWRTR